MPNGGVFVSAPDWRVVTPPPATEETAVIVPVMRRPGSADPFMRSLRASTGLATAYAICDADDEETIGAWGDAGATTLIRDPAGRPGTFAEKVNAAYRSTDEPWLFITGDDVQFRPGWLDHAQHVARIWNVSVVGTNDLGSKMVRGGEHATHLLISRRYIDGVGASWSGPGVVCHEGYRHWFVDNEIVTAAKQRGAWRMAPGSIVEHMHPLFGKGADDPVYELGRSFGEADREEYERRCAIYV